MNEQRKLTLEDFLANERLNLEYTTQLPPQVGGVLDDRSAPTYIAVNATHPPFEQHFSIANALGSYHLPRLCAARPPWFQKLFNRKWNNRYMRLWMRTTRRWFHRNFNQQKQSELFALVIIMRLGYKEDLHLYLKKHPEMTKWAICLSLIMLARDLKRQLVSFVKRLFTFNSAIP